MKWTQGVLWRDFRFTACVWWVSPPPSPAKRIRILGHVARSTRLVVYENGYARRTECTHKVWAKKWPYYRQKARVATLMITSVFPVSVWRVRASARASYESSDPLVVVVLVLVVVSLDSSLIPWVEERVRPCPLRVICIETSRRRDKREENPKAELSRENWSLMLTAVSRSLARRETKDLFVCNFSSDIRE